MGETEARLAAREAVHKAVIDEDEVLLKRFSPKKVLSGIKKEKGDYWHQIVRRAFLEKGIISENGG